MNKKQFGGTAWAAGCPCLPGCPDRAAGCHGKCAAYLEYEKRANELRQRRLNEVSGPELSRDAEVRIRRWMRHKSRGS